MIPLTQWRAIVNKMSYWRVHVSSRAILWACCVVSSSPWHKQQLNTIFSISYNAIWNFLILCIWALDLFHFYKKMDVWKLPSAFAQTGALWKQASMEGKKEWSFLLATPQRYEVNCPKKNGRQNEVLLILPSCPCCSWPDRQPAHAFFISLIWILHSPTCKF